MSVVSRASIHKSLMVRVIVISLFASGCQGSKSKSPPAETASNATHSPTGAASGSPESGMKGAASQWPVPWSAAPDPGNSSEPGRSAEFPIRLGDATEVRFPYAGRPLALSIRQGKPSLAELHDLSSGIKLGSIASPEMMPPELTVSPDGTRLAGKVLETGPDHVRLWSFKTGRIDGDRILANEGSRYSPLSLLRFSKNDQLVGVRGGPGGGQVVVMDLGQTSQPRTFVLASPGIAASIPDQAIGISPGGSYFAAIVGSSLVIHDLESGRCAGSSDLPPGAPEIFHCSELVFSPDGRFLATIVSPASGEAVWLLEWDCTTGKLLRQVNWHIGPWLKTVSGFVPSRDEHPLVWLPDASGWILYGRLFWKRDEEAPRPAFASGEDMQPRHVLDAQRVTAVVQERGKLSLVLVQRQGAEVAAVTPTSKPGGEPDPESMKWSVTSDPAMLRPKFGVNPIVFFGTVPQTPRLSKRPGRVGACAIQGEYILFDLETGKELQRIRPETPALLLQDVSPDGRYLVVASPASGEQVAIEVWNVATGERIWTASREVGGGDFSIEFLGLHSLLMATVDRTRGGRKYVVSDIEGNATVLEFTSFEGQGTYLPNSHVVTPGGQFALAAFSDTLVASHLGTGRIVGELKLPLAPGRINPSRVLAAGATLDGAHLYLLVSYHDDSVKLLSIKLTTGQIEDCPIDGTSLKVAAGHVSWNQVPWLMDESRELICGRTVIDVERGAVLGTFDLQGDATILALTDDEFLVGLQIIGDSGNPAAGMLRTKLQPRIRESLASRMEKLRPEPAPAHGSATPRVTTPPAPVSASPSIAPPMTPAATATADQRPWTSIVDPPTDAKPWSAAPKIDYAVPRNARFFPSERGGPMLLAADDDGERAEVLDLSKGTRVGESVAWARRAEVAAVSPDGRFVAYNRENEVVIVNTLSGKSSTVKRDGSFVSCRYLGVAANNVVVAAFTVDDRIDVCLYQAEDGNPVREFALARRGDDWGALPTALTISPGGHYLAALSYDGLVICRLTQPGQQASVVPYADTRSQLAFFRCDGIRFSPDGTRLAAVYHQMQRNFLTLWNMETGEPILQRRYPRSIDLRTITHSSAAPGLVWFPDGDLLVFQGTTLVDPQTGHPFWVLPDDDLTAVIPLGGANMLGVDAAQQKLINAPLPPDIAKSKKVVRATSVFAVPPLTSASRTAPVPAGDEIARGAASVPDALSGPFARKSIRLDHPNLQNKPDRIVVSSGGILAVERSEEYFSANHAVITRGPLPPQRSVLLEAYDIASGKRLHQLEVPDSIHLLDASSDGSLLLTGDDQTGLGEFGRIDVWSLKLGRHAAGWRPAPMEASSADLCRWAAFVDRRHVLTLNSAGLTLWRLPECRSVYTLTTSDPPSLSANRKYLVERKKFLIRDAITGAALVKLGGSDGNEHLGILDAAFIADGKRLIGVTHDGASNSVVQWDVADGKIVDEFAIPPAQFNRLALLGDRGILLMLQPELAGHGLVQIDRRQRQLVAQLKGNGAHAASPDGTYWRTEFVPDEHSGAYFARGFDMASFSWPTLDPDLYSVVGRGSAVRVEVRSNLAEAGKIRSVFVERIHQAEWMSDDSAATRAVLEANEETRVLRKGPPDITAKVVSCRLALIDSRGVVAWEMKDQRARGESPEFDVVEWVRTRPLPRRLFAGDWQQRIPNAELPALRPGAGDLR